MNANVSPLLVMYCAKPLPGRKIWTKGQFALLQRRNSYQLIFQERKLRHCKLKLFAQSHLVTLQRWDSYPGPRGLCGWILYLLGTDLTKLPKEKETHRCRRTESTSWARHLKTLECSAQKKDEWERLRRSALTYLKALPMKEIRHCLLCMP